MMKMVDLQILIKGILLLGIVKVGRIIEETDVNFLRHEEFSISVGRVIRLEQKNR